MKTDTVSSELEQSIIRVTMKINQQFPELSKFLEEMPKGDEAAVAETISNQTLQDYHDSLIEVLEEYSKTHAGNQPDQ